MSPAAEPRGCDEELSRGTLVACAQARSPLIAAELASLQGAKGKVEAARPFLPSNPLLTGSLGSRTGGGMSATNWSVTLAQELEVAGQSGLRVDVARGDLVAQGQQLTVVRAELAEQAWLAWFQALASKERVALALRIEQASLEVARTAQGMSTQGLSSPVDAAVADAAAVSASQQRLEAESAVRAAEIRLRLLVGASATPRVTGALEPLRWDEASLERPEVASLTALSRAAAHRVELLRRSRAPNPTLSFFAQNDGFDEKVFGVGLGIPIPLPQPLGRTYSGEIAEAVGAGHRLEAELDRLTRTLNGERELASSEYGKRLAARALYSAERLARANHALAAISTQLSAGRLSVREALVSQQALVGFLEAEVNAREALCAASVRLIRTHGGSLEGGAL
ncbi:MAG: TolC family protein [Archangium sp.]|nr:TolC family protein [Archangium sp.]